MSKFVMHPSLIPLLARSSQMGRAMLEGATQVLEEAQSLAPVFAGHYKEGLRVELSVKDGKVVGRVIADDPTGAGGLIEFGSIHNPAFAPLRRALTAVFGSAAQA